MLSLARNGIAQVEPNKEFSILVANFRKKPVTLLKDQKIGTADAHLTRIVESTDYHAW